MTVRRAHDGHPYIPGDMPPPLGQPIGLVERMVVFGTAADCNVRVNDPYASPHHCRVFQDDESRVYVEDLGSTNGTRVRWRNGMTIKVIGWQQIGPGGVLIVGRTEIPWTDRSHR